MYTQFNPGMASKVGVDTYEKRKYWFGKALEKFYETTQNLKSVAIPHLIGCTKKVGGDWTDYYVIIGDVAFK